LTVVLSRQVIHFRHDLVPPRIGITPNSYG
jgi:hypothetical protein